MWTNLNTRLCNKSDPRSVTSCKLPSLFDFMAQESYDKAKTRTFPSKSWGSQSLTQHSWAEVCATAHHGKTQCRSQCSTQYLYVATADARVEPEGNKQHYNMISHIMTTNYLLPFNLGTLLFPNSELLFLQTLTDVVDSARLMTKILSLLLSIGPNNYR